MEWFLEGDVLPEWVQRTIGYCQDPQDQASDLALLALGTISNLAQENDTIRCAAGRCGSHLLAEGKKRLTDRL